MSMDIAFFNTASNDQPLKSFSFSSVGFKLLIDSNLFKLPHVSVRLVVDDEINQDVHAIDLKANRKEVHDIFAGYKMSHSQLQEMIACVGSYEYFCVL